MKSIDEIIAQAWAGRDAPPITPWHREQASKMLEAVREYRRLGKSEDEARADHLAWIEESFRGLGAPESDVETAVAMASRVFTACWAATE